jgi:ferrochelatase
MPTTRSSPTGVVLLDLGGVRSPSEVRGFIARMLSDPEILHIPAPIRIPLAQLIAFKRAASVARKYAEIGYSPIHAETAAIKSALAAELGDAYRVAFAFRHSPPYADEVLTRLRAEGVGRVLALPLFPQRSWATTRTCVTALTRAAERKGMECRQVLIEPDGDGLIAAIMAKTAPLLTGCEHVLFTAHGLPMRNVNKGDPYPGDVARTAEALRAHLPADLPSTVVFQSRVGPVRWLEPHLDTTVTALGGDGARRLTVVPIAFLTENLETNHELDIETRELAEAAGIESFRRAPVPGHHRALIVEIASSLRAATTQAGWDTAKGAS